MGGGADLRHQESLREEHDLADLLQVGHDHYHRSEQSLHGLRQFRAPRIARVHGDEDPQSVVQVDLRALELTTNTTSMRKDHRN